MYKDQQVLPIPLSPWSQGSCLRIKKKLKQMLKMSQQSECRVGSSTCRSWRSFSTPLDRFGTEGSPSFVISVPTLLRFLAVCDTPSKNPPSSNPAFKVKGGLEGIVKIVPAKPSGGFGRGRRWTGQQQKPDTSNINKTPYVLLYSVCTWYQTGLGMFKQIFWNIMFGVRAARFLINPKPDE